MVAPKSSVTFSLPKDEDNTRIVTWQAITDSGSPTTVEKKYSKQGADILKSRYFYSPQPCCSHQYYLLKHPMRRVMRQRVSSILDMQ